MVTPLSMNPLPWESPISESPSHGLAAPTPIPSQLPSVAPHALREEERVSTDDVPQEAIVNCHGCNASLFFHLLSSFRLSSWSTAGDAVGGTTSGLVNGFDDVRPSSCLVAVDAGVFGGQHVVPLARCLSSS